MPDILFRIQVADLRQLIEQIQLGAARYCAYPDDQRAHYLEKRIIFMHIDLWDDRHISATPIVSAQGYGLDRSRDFVLMDGPKIDMAIEGNLLLLLENMKSCFVTETDLKNAKDILLWEIHKPS